MPRSSRSPKQTGIHSTPTVNTTTCTTLQTTRLNGLHISSHFSGYQQSNWAGCAATGENCAMTFTVPDLTTPLERECRQGNVPTKYVGARGVEDIQKTLGLVKGKGVRLVVKNTGHDYLGKSSGVGALGLWTHNIQPPIELTREFVPDECSEAVGNVIIFGAGQQFAGVYDVGVAGGWLAGGGHSMQSNELGLGVDNVQQIKAVLPNGTYITASRCQNQDIFFALRGGGGGTFGVVTEISYSVHPKKPMQFARVAIAGLDEDDILPAAVGGVSTISLGTTLLDIDEARVSMQPLIDFANRPVESGTLGNASVITADYFNILQGVMARSEELILPSSAWAFSSRLVPRGFFVGDNQQQLASTLHDILTTAQEQDVAASSDLLMYAVTPNLYSRTMPESGLPGGPGASSVTPAWRNGLWHVIFTRQFEGTTTDPDVVQKVWQTTHDIMNPLRDITPTGGAYQNEADPFEPDAVRSFWGEENYARLLRIKKEVDPTNFLTVHGAIGWDETDERYSCYTDVKV
ncbi:hypothetical protein BJX70DRAFT_392161 [Aspergillus crustosus]